MTLEMKLDVRNTYPDFSVSDYRKELAKGLILGNLPWQIQEKKASERYSKETIDPYYVATLNTRSSRFLNGALALGYVITQISGLDLHPFADVAGIYLTADTVIRESAAEILRRWLPNSHPADTNNEPNPSRRVAVGSSILEIPYWINLISKGSEERNC